MLPVEACLFGTSAWLSSSGRRLAEAEDCQIRTGTRLVFHQLPTSPLG